VLASDGREQSDGSLIAARLVAARLGVPFEVVTVLEPLPVYGTSDGDELAALAEVDRRPIREARVRRQIETLTPQGEHWLLHVRYGSFAHEVAAVARERAASLVVVGAAPHHRLGFVVAGARAAQLLHILDCPVLSTAPEFTGVPSRTVVATDFAPPSIRAAEATLRLLEAGDTLTLVHAVPVYDAYIPPSPPLTSDSRARAESSMSHLRSALALRAPAGVTLKTHIIDGGVEWDLIEYARAQGAGLIAVGTHGPGVWERLFVGSSASSILHAAKSSVLACPPPPAADRVRLQLQATDTVTLPRQDDWQTFLTDVSTRNAGRTASLEIDDPDLGAQIQGVGLRFTGAAYDPHDDRVELMFGSGPHSTQHLTHTIGSVTNLALLGGADGRDRALEVHQQRESTILTFAVE